MDISHIRILVVFLDLYVTHAQGEENIDLRLSQKHWNKSETQKAWGVFELASLSPFPKVGSPYGVLAYVLDCDIEVSKFEPQSFYYIHFRTNAPLGKA